MAKRSSKKFHWATLLGNALLFQASLLPASGLAAAAFQDVVIAPQGRPANSTVIADAETRGDSSNMDSTLYLDVQLNGMASGIAQFSLRGDELWASVEVLRRMGFVLSEGEKGPVRLNGLPGVRSVYDVTRQRVNIDAPLQLLKLPTTALNMPGTRVQPAAASPGAVLNYDLYGTQDQHGGATLSALTELRAFNNAGVLSSTALTQWSRSEAGQWQNSTKRLDTTWSKSFQDSMISLRAGDVFTGSLPWTRSTRIGGIQLSTNFALQPYRVTTPLPTFLGSATLPSNVELYVNGLHQYSGKVPAGPFQLSALPNITGSGNAQMVLTDVMGRSTTLNFSLYESQQLLQKGLSDWTVDIGAVRQNYGLTSFDYAPNPAVSGTWRHGLTDQFTVETHGEASSGLLTGGVGGVWLLGPTMGELSGSLAHSARGDQSGSQFGFGYSWRADRFNFGINGTGTRGDYLDVAALNGSPPVRTSRTVLAGYNTDSFGSFGLSHIRLGYSGQQETRLITAYWFRVLSRSTSINANLNQNLNARNDRSISFGITMMLDGNVNVTSGIQHDQGGASLALDASSSVPNEGGVGWRAGLREGGGRTGGLAEVELLGRYGRAAAGVNVLGDSRFAYASASGGLVLMGGHPFAARRIDDAFAVVSTDGVPGVPVSLENRLIGETDEKGLLLVTPLRAYQNNQLAIDPMRLPADVRIDRVNALATPSDRAGTLVHFGIKPLRAASLVLVDVADKPLPLGSLVRRPGQSADQPALVGFDGAVYLEDLNTANTLDVETPDGACQVQFAYPSQMTGIPQLGPFRCTKEVTP